MVVTSKPSGNPTMTGRRLADRYELVDRIGSGGMAEVWRARDHSLGRDVAVKLLHRHLVEDDSILARFRSEAQSAARLTHPGIVAIFDTVTTEDTDAIIMEMVEGEDLRSILDARGTLAIEDAVEVTMQLAHALGHAHQNGIIHRDIKPANIIVRPDRRVKLSDFGIAKALGDTTLTDSGSLVGTVKYLAPEQIEGRPLDGRADLYSLSIVLFEMICGQVPFPSTDLVSAMDRIKRVAPRARTIRPDIPGDLDDFLARSLARDPVDRPADAKTYAASLAAAMRRTAAVDPTPVLSARPAAQIPQPQTPAPAAPARPQSIPMRKPATAEVPKARKRRRRRRDLLWPLLAAALMLAALITVWILLRPASNVVTDQLQSTDSADSDLETSATTGTEASAGEGSPGTSAQGDQPTSSSSSSSSSSTSTSTTSIPFTGGVRLLAFDPLGDGEEHGDLTIRAIDDDDATFWNTESYNTRLFGGIKEGVGIIIEFEEPTKIIGFSTITNTSGWAARLYEADESQSSLEAWGEPLKFYEDVPSNATLDTLEMTTTAVLLWFTDLGEAPAGDQTDTETPMIRLELYDLEFIQ